MRPVYIVLTDTGTLFTRMIKRVTGAPYNHASIALDPQFSGLYSFGRKSLRMFWKAGFVREQMNAGIFAALKDTTCIVYELMVDEETYERIEREIQRFEQEAPKYKYNLIGFLNFLIRRPLPRKSAFFCSEFVATVLERAGVSLLRRPPGLTAPHDFMAVRALRPIYEGPLSAYRPPLPHSRAELTA